MRLANLTLPALMLVLLLCNVVLYGGFLQSEHAITFASAANNQPFDGGARAGSATPQGAQLPVRSGAVLQGRAA